MSLKIVRPIRHQAPLESLEVSLVVFFALDDSRHFLCGRDVVSRLNRFVRVQIEEITDLLFRKTDAVSSTHLLDNTPMLKKSVAQRTHRTCATSLRR
jgi:energy-converting hydrogenase A subunit M